MNFNERVNKRIQEYQPDLTDREALYMNLCLEETQERKTAEYNRDIVEAYDGICDIIRTAYGINEKRWDAKLNQLTDVMNSSHYNLECFRECFDEVERSNRTKSKDTREDWKILKGENYKAPDLKPIIKKYHLHCNI